MPIPMLILDTNVIVSSFRSSLGASFRMIELIGKGRFEIGLTAALVLEYESVCKRMVGLSWLSNKDVDNLIEFLCHVGRKSIVHYHLRPVANDPGDDLVLEAAVASKSDWIVTYNVRDLSAAAASYGVETLTPSVALKRLGE